MNVKELISNIIHKIKEKGVTTIDVGQLKNNSWFHVSDSVLTEKEVYIFKSEEQLLISRNGEVQREKWEYLTHATNGLIIEIENKAKLYNILYLTSEYLMLQQDGTELFKVFIKQQRYESNLHEKKAISFVEQIFGDLNTFLNEQNSKHLIDINSGYLAKPTSEFDEMDYDENVTKPQKSTEISKIITPKAPRQYSFVDFRLEKRDGKWGWIDPDGMTVIEFKFDDAFNFSEGLAAVIIDGKRGYINTKGKFVITPQYDLEGTFFFEWCRSCE